MNRWHSLFLAFLWLCSGQPALAGDGSSRSTVYWVDFDPCPPCPPIIVIIAAPEPEPVEEICPPAVLLQVLVPAEATPGKEVEYCLCVENRSDMPAHHVVVHDPLPAHARFARSEPQPAALEPTMQWRLGTIEGGGKRVIRLWLAPTGSGDIQNCVRITYEHGVCVTTKVLKPPVQPPPQPQAQIPEPPTRPPAQPSVPAPPPAVTESVGEPRLRLTKTAPTKQYMSVPIPYRLTVINEGTAAARNVVITDRLPAQSTFISASDDGQNVGGQVQWSLGTIPPRGSRTVELRIRAQATGEFINLAEAQAEGVQRVTAEVRTEINGASGLVMEVVDIVDPVEVGQQTEYHVILRNTGSVPITNLKINAIIPDEMAVVRVQGTVRFQKIERLGREPERVIYDPITLPANQDTVYRVFVQAMKAGDARFRVEVTADQLGVGPVTQEESTTVFPAPK